MAPFGTVAIVLLSAIMLLPLRTAEPAMSMAASTLPTPALPTAAWSAPTAKPAVLDAPFEAQPPKF